MDMNRMTIKLQEALQTASSHATRRSHQGIDVEHLLLAFVEQDGGLAARYEGRLLRIAIRFAFEGSRRPLGGDQSRPDDEQSG